MGSDAAPAAATLSPNPPSSKSVVSRCLLWQRPRVLRSHLRIVFCANIPVFALMTLTVLVLALTGGSRHILPLPRAHRVASAPTKAVTAITNWSVYGRTNSHTHDLADGPLPPFYVLWRVRVHALLEFSPIIEDGWLYQLDDAGVLRSYNAVNGHLRWQRKIGKISAASPVYAQGRVFALTLSGQVVAVDGETGAILWRQQILGGSESSPVVAGSKVYFGSEDGWLYALSVERGRILWRVRADGALKAAAALAASRLFIGSYGGSFYAVDDSGRIL